MIDSICQSYVLRYYFIIYIIIETGIICGNCINWEKVIIVWIGNFRLLTDVNLIYLNLDTWLIAPGWSRLTMFFDFFLLSWWKVRHRGLVARTLRCKRGHCRLENITLWTCRFDILRNFSLILRLVCHLWKLSNWHLQIALFSGKSTLSYLRVVT